MFCGLALGEEKIRGDAGDCERFTEVHVMLRGETCVEKSMLSLVSDSVEYPYSDASIFPRACVGFSESQAGYPNRSFGVCTSLGIFGAFGKIWYASPSMRKRFVSSVHCRTMSGAMRNLA
jgi:hypothetical protein